MVSKNQGDHEKHKEHPEMNKHSRLQYAGGGLSPLRNLKKISPVLCLGTLVLRINAPAHTLSRP